MLRQFPDEAGRAGVSGAQTLSTTTRAVDLPIGTRLQPTYPGRPDWVVYRKVRDDSRWGWALEQAGGAIAASDIDRKLAKGELVLLTNGEDR